MEKGFYKVGFWVLVVGLLLAGAFGAGGYFLKGYQPGGKEGAVVKEASVEEVVEEVIRETAEEDEVVPDEPTRTLSLTPVPSETEEALEKIMAGLFALKYGKDESMARISIQMRNEEYVSGGIVFEGEMGGGWFLAAKDEGEWVIVADGNGTVPCEKIEIYDFPTEMVPECWSETEMRLIER